MEILTGKPALITGAGKGLGKSIALAALLAGHLKLPGRALVKDASLWSANP